MDIDFTGISGYNTLINTGRCSVDEIFDLLIIGSGPAGVSAALTARHRGKSALIITTSPEDSPLYRAEHVDRPARRDGGRAGAKLCEPRGEVRR